MKTSKQKYCYTKRSSNITSCVVPSYPLMLPFLYLSSFSGTGGGSSA